MMNKTYSINYLLNNIRLKRIYIYAIFLNFILCLPVYASIVIWPTNLVIQHNEKATVLWLENRGDQLKVMQLRIFKWSQIKGEDQLIEQQEVIGSPPIMRVEPGKQQMIRLITRQPAPAGQELTYRIMVDEIPIADNSKQGVNFQLRYSLPLFVYGSGLEHNQLPANIDQQLLWHWVKQNGQIWLELHNNSNMHIHLSDIKFYPTKSTMHSSYILPQSTIKILIPKNVSEPQKITALINGEKQYTLKKQ